MASLFLRTPCGTLSASIHAQERQSECSNITPAGQPMLMFCPLDPVSFCNACRNKNSFNKPMLPTDTRSIAQCMYRCGFETHAFRHLFIHRIRLILLFRDRPCCSIMNLDRFEFRSPCWRLQSSHTTFGASDPTCVCRRS